MARAPESGSPDGEHGAHTLRIVRGEVVGVFGDDVFVELGPRMQGVLSRRAFDEPPRVGEIREFTLRGQEDTLWALALAPGAGPGQAAWQDLEAGSVVQARVTGRNRGGLELKVGPLHAFMPRSHTGLPRGADLRQLVGKTFPCEVLEVDSERERVVLSRRLVQARERRSEQDRAVTRLKAGEVVRGRISRVERYGVFVRFGAGLSGLVHVSDLSHERVPDPASAYRVGDELEARVLSVKRGGQRIALGVKQLEESPWTRLERDHYVGQVLEGEVVRATSFGAFVRVRPGVEGLLHRSEAALPDGADPRRALRPGTRVGVRILSLDCAAERLSLSRLSASGAPLADDAAGEARWSEHLPPPDREVGALARLLERALRRSERPGGR